MSEDARFEDAQDAPLRLIARDAEDLQVISALIQDSVLPSSEISWLPAENRFALLINRFRWEGASRSSERVQSVLVFDCVESVKTDSIDPTDKDQILSLLAIELTEQKDCQAQINIALAGNGDIRLNVECIEVILQDATRPYDAPSGAMPSHKLDA